MKKPLDNYLLTFYGSLLICCMIAMIIPSCGPSAEQKAQYQAALKENPDSIALADYEIKLLFEVDSMRVYRFYDNFDCNCGNGGYFHFTVDLRSRQVYQEPIVIPDEY